jgi:hypothetical protein
MLRAVLSSLDLLATDGEDCATTSGARGLVVRLRDFRFVVTLFVLNEIFMTAFPGSRQLQGIAVDLAMAAKLVTSCRQKFEDMRSDGAVDVAWQQILQRSTSLAHKFDIDTNIVERHRRRRLMDGEVGIDESRTGEERLRVDMFLPVLDQICLQRKYRFDSAKMREYRTGKMRE